MHQPDVLRQRAASEVGVGVGLDRQAAVVPVEKGAEHAFAHGGLHVFGDYVNVVATGIPTSGAAAEEATDRSPRTNRHWCVCDNWKTGRRQIPPLRGQTQHGDVPPASKAYSHLETRGFCRSTRVFNRLATGELHAFHGCPCSC